MSGLKNNKHIFYNYRHCVLQTRPMCILCGDTIYKCNKFISVEENDNYYIVYMRVQTTIDLYETRYVACYLWISGDAGCVSMRTTEQTMLKVLVAMLRYTQQNKSSEDICEIFFKKGYYVDKCIFKFLDLCRSVRLRLDPVIDGWIAM
jgi:hypothetical protein